MYDTTPAAPAPLDDAGPKGHLAAFLSLNILFILVLAVGSALYAAVGIHIVVYLILLFAICSSPLLLATRLHGRYVILLIFMPLYFLFFGIADLLAVFDVLPAGERTGGSGLLSGAEYAILFGAVLLILGFALAASGTVRRTDQPPPADWKHSTIVLLGLVLWVLGMIGSWMWQFGFADRLHSGDVTLLSSIIQTILRMVAPLGTALIVYAYCVMHNKATFLLLLVMLTAEFVFGFLADSKELAMRGLILLILGKFLLHGRIPKTWLVLGATLLALTFAIFYAYRYEVLQIRHTSRQSAMENISDNFRKALRSSKLKEGAATSGLKSFAGRVNLKGNMELIVHQTGDRAPFQDGYTLKLFLYSFVPRLIWPDKPDSSIGRLFNREFRISLDPNTYISVTYLGELFWNFGWPGLIAGMFIMGLLWGALSKRLSLADAPSVTRYLLLISTIYLLCVRFEGGIALQYSLWLRSVVLIYLLHWLFRQPTRAATDAPAAIEGDERKLSAGVVSGYPQR